MLNAENIVVHLNRRAIVKDISLTAKAGDVTCIVGPNGSGKTTLLKALTGELPFTGRVTLNDADISAASPAELAGWRAVLPQSASLSFPFTVHEVVRLGLVDGIYAPQHAAARVDEALAAVGLSGFGGWFYQELSGGEAQRVQLARVLAQVWEPILAGKPRCLFLDEPISSLDIKHQLQVLELASSYAHRGAAVIAILHDLNLTAHFADHVVLLHQGERYAFGPAREVLTSENLEAVYGCPMAVGVAPPGQKFFILPQLPPIGPSR